MGLISSVYSCFHRYTESCLSGSLSPMSFTGTLKATWSPSLTSQDYLLSSHKNYKTMEFNTSSPVITHANVLGVNQKLTVVSSRCCFLFKVQAEVIPAILESTEQGLLIGRGGYKPRDICVSAPTGSGKTLAFVIPVIQVS